MVLKIISPDCRVRASLMLFLLFFLTFVKFDFIHEGNFIAFKKNRKLKTYLQPKDTDPVTFHMHVTITYFNISLPKYSTTKHISEYFIIYSQDISPFRSNSSKFLRNFQMHIVAYSYMQFINCGH